MNETPAIELESATKVLSKKFELGRRRAFSRLFFGQRRSRMDVNDEEYFALKNITLRIEKGQRLAILCPSRDVHEIMVRLLCGLSMPTKGTIRRSSPIRLMSTKSKTQRPLLNLRTQLLALSSFLGVCRKDASATVDRVLELCQATTLQKERLVDLNPDLLGRLTYFTSLLAPAEIYLFNEVFLADFLPLQQEVLKGKTVLCVSFRMKYPREFFDSGIVLNEGGIAFQGRLEEAEQCFERLRATSEPPMSALFDYESDDDDTDFAIELAQAPRQVRNTREIAISGITIRNTLGIPNGPIKTGETALFDVHYEAARGERVPGPVSVALTLRTPKNIRVACTWSEVIRKQLPVNPPRGTFRLTIPRLPLLSGTYGVNVAILQGDVLFDKMSIDDCVVVAPGNFYGYGEVDSDLGFVCFDYDWTAIETNDLTSAYRNGRRETDEPTDA